MGTVALLAADYWILRRLGEPSRFGVAREMWSGLVVCTAIVALCIVSLATSFPYVKVSEALLPPAHAQNLPRN